MEVVRARAETLFTITMCFAAHHGFPRWADSEREAAPSETQADFWRTAQSIGLWARASNRAPAQRRLRAGASLRTCQVYAPSGARSTRRSRCGPTEPTGT